MLDKARADALSGGRRGGRVVEGAPLLREYGLIAHRGFESLPLRHSAFVRPEDTGHSLHLGHG